MLQLKVSVTDSIDSKKPFVDWLSIVETHCLLVMQQVVLSPAHNIYRPFSICSDFTTPFDPFSKALQLPKKIFFKICFLFSLAILPLLVLRICFFL